MNDLKGAVRKRVSDGLDRAPRKFRVMAFPAVETREFTVSPQFLHTSRTPVDDP